MIELCRINGDFNVCKITDVSQVDFTQGFVFLSKTLDEISLVCEAKYMPPNMISYEPGWRMLKIKGTLDFGLVGIVAKITGILAQASISVFIVSTYNTDYILLKHENFAKGIEALERNGYIVD